MSDRSAAPAGAIRPGDLEHTTGSAARGHQWRVFLGLTLAAARRGTSDRLLGAAWWLLDPLILIGVYALVFGEWLGLREGPEGADYPLFLACALVPWRAFSHATSAGASAFTRHRPMLTSVPLSRHTVVLSEQAAAWLAGLAGVAVLIAFMLLYDQPFGLELFGIIPALVTLVLLGMGISYALCPLTTLLPDAGNLWSAALRVAWFLSPGLWSIDRLSPDTLAWLMAVNPFVGVFEGIRRPVFGQAPPWEALAWSAAWAIALLLLGRGLFTRLAPRAVRML